MKTQAGFSLSELLVTLLLSSILITVLLQAYIHHKRQYRLVEQSIEKQIDINWVSDLVRLSVMNAGFTPCLPLSQLMRSNNQVENHPLNDLIIDNQTQSLISQYMHSEFFEVFEFLTDKSFVVVNEARFRSKETIIISDCFHAEVHAITHIEKTGMGKVIFLQEPLIFHYSANAYLGRWIKEKWFIKQNKKGDKALYYQNNKIEELTTKIKGLTVSEKKYQGKRILKINFKLKGDKKFQFFVTRRNH